MNDLLIHVGDLSPGMRAEWLRKFPNFTPEEPNLACPCCGEIYIGPETFLVLEMVQRTRDILKAPVRLNSGHRCGIHNALVGGAPLSTHKKFATDISTRGHDRKAVRAAMIAAGYRTFGLYRTFIHGDYRIGRLWYGKGAKALWNG